MKEINTKVNDRKKFESIVWLSDGKRIVHFGTGSPANLQLKMGVGVGEWRDLHLWPKNLIFTSLSDKVKPALS